MMHKMPEICKPQELMVYGGKPQQLLKDAILVLLKVLELPSGALKSAIGESPGTSEELVAFLEQVDFSKTLVLTIEKNLKMEFFCVDGQLCIQHHFAQHMLPENYAQKILDLAASKQRSEVGQLVYEQESQRFSLMFTIQLTRLDEFFLAIWLPLFIESILLWKPFVTGKSEVLENETELQRIIPIPSEKVSLKVQLQVIDEGEEEESE